MENKKLDEALKKLPLETQEKFKIALRMIMELQEKSKPMMDRVKVDLSTTEFNEELHFISPLGIKLVEPDKKQVVMPALYVYSTKQENGKRNVLSIMFPNLPEDKRKVMFSAGIKYGEDMFDEIAAIYFIMEAWQAEYRDMKEADKIRPSKNPDRQEVLMIAGLTLDGRVNTVSIPIKRIENEQRKIEEDKATWREYDEKSDKKFNTKPEILEAFMAGYLEGRIHNGRVKN